MLETIFRKGPITRPEIAAATNLSKPTVSAAVSRLEQEGLVRAAGRRAGQRGRKPVAYVVSPRAGFVVGGDIGGSNLRVAAADLFGEPICDLKQPTAKDGSRAVGVQILEMVSEVIDQASAVHGRPLALGISSPGIVDQASGRVTSLAYNVAPEGGFDPLEVIRDRFDLPVLVENNVNLAAVGEKWFGLARGVSTMVFIAIGAGIGMGIIIDDELVRGAHGAAGEIGYLPLVGDPFDPRHRLHGGLEDEIGAAGIVAAFNERRGAERSGARRRSTRCSSSPAPGTRRRGRWSTTSPRASARRSRPCARSSTRSWSCSAEASARARCCCRPVRGVGGRAGSDHRADRDQPARASGRRCRERSRSPCTPRARRCSPTAPPAPRRTGRDGPAARRADALRDGVPARIGKELSIYPVAAQRLTGDIVLCLDISQMTCRLSVPG